MVSVIELYSANLPGRSKYFLSSTISVFVARNLGCERWVSMGGC